MFQLADFKKYKHTQRKISMMTCYDFTFAQLVNRTAIDMILVGDSAAMVMHGAPSTVAATMDMMLTHARAVVKGAPDKWIVGDLPFLSYRKGLRSAMDAIQQMMQTGVNMIKLEGASGNEALVAHVVQSGVPVMGHLGLTPQLVHQLGGFRVQGKAVEDAEKLLAQAKSIEAAGASACVLECVPEALGKLIAQSLAIPVIGIGAGGDVDGQVLVLHDMLGLNPAFKPKYLKTYCDGFASMQSAIDAYVDDVQALRFPEAKHCYA